MNKIKKCSAALVALLLVLSLCACGQADLSRA